MLWTESFLVFFQSQEYGIQELMVESDTKVMGLSLFVLFFFFFSWRSCKSKGTKINFIFSNIRPQLSYYSSVYDLAYIYCILH